MKNILQKATEELARKVAENEKLCFLLQQRIGDGGFKLESRTDTDQDGNVSITFYPVFDEYKYKVYPDD